MVDAGKLDVVTRSPWKRCRFICQSSVISERRFDINFPGVQQTQNMIDPPWLFLDANSGYAEHYPAKQRGQPGYNHSRAPYEKTYRLAGK
jgi:hypothetical protein